MEFSSTLQLVDSLIHLILGSVDFKLREKELAAIAEKAVANEFTQVGRQFVKLIAPNKMTENILSDDQPQKMRADCMAKFSIDSRSKTPSIDTLRTTGKISKRRRSSVAKLAPVATKENPQKSFIKLAQQVRQPPGQTEEMLRRFYLVKLQNDKKDKQLKELQQRQKQRLKRKQGSFLMDRQFFIYDYNGKVLNGRGKAKSMSLATSVKSGINRKTNIIKKVERRVVEPQTVNTFLCESTYRNSRKVSVQMKQQMPSKESNFNETPMFQKAQPANPSDTSSMKLIEFQKLCRRKRPYQQKFFVTEAKQSASLPTVNLQVSNVLIGPRKRHTRLHTESFHSRKMSREAPIDRIRVNTQLYQSMIVDD